MDDPYLPLEGDLTLVFDRLVFWTYMAFCIGVLPLSHILQGNFPEATEKVKSLWPKISHFTIVSAAQFCPNSCSHPKHFQGEDLSPDAEDELDRTILAGWATG